MPGRRGLAQRIVIGFTLMAVLVAGIFSLGIVGTVYMIEEQLISTSLGGDLDRLLRMDNLEDWHAKPQADQLFYYSGGTGEMAIPEDVAALPLGFHELYRRHHAYHVMVKEVDGRRYALLQDQTEFEKRERALFKVVFLGFLICVALSVVLGLLMARTVMAPLIRLAEHVRQREAQPGQQPGPPLAKEYAADEVGELASAFDKAMDRLWQALTRERLFTSDVSHELRTPITVVSTSCELLQADPSLAGNSRVRRHLNKIERANLEMNELTQTFLQLARGEHDQVLTGPSTCLSAMADELSEQWQDAFAAKGLHFECVKKAPSDAPVPSAFIRTVMLNLLRNALHYTQQGQVRLSIEGSRFSVSDTGSGIPEAQREAIFELFQRGEQAAGEGQGVGLSLVRRICQLQGWQIQLQAQNPQGSCFSVDCAPRAESL